jgi:hypothetical protein
MRFYVIVPLLLVACGGASSNTAPQSVAPKQETNTANVTAKTTDGASESSDDDDGSCQGAACLKLCDTKHRRGDCENAGEALRTGSDGVKEDEKAAVPYLQKACELQSREGCYRLADLYESSEVVPHDDVKVVALFGRACDLGRGDACDQLSRRADSGTGMAKDHKKAIALLVKGCVAEDYQVWTCNRLRETAEKKDPDASAALAQWKSACDAKKDATACAGVDRTTKKSR